MTQPVEEMIEDIEEKQEAQSSGLDKLKQKVLKSDWVMTSKGQFISRPEWHAFTIGVSFPALAFMLPTPLGEFMIIAMLLMLRSGFKRLGSDLTGHMADVMHELAYMMMGALITVTYFTYFTTRRLERVDFGKIIAQLLLGA